METFNDYSRIDNLLKHVRQNNPYFAQEIYNKAPDISWEEFYDSLPVLNKADIYAGLESYVTNDFTENMKKIKNMKSYFTEVKELSSNHDRIVRDDYGTEWILETTTGSTGKPFTVLKNANEKMLESQVLFMLRKQHFSKVSVKNGFLLLQPIDPYLKSISYRGNTDKNMDLVFEHLMRVKPKWILATALLIRKLHNYIIKNNFQGIVRKLNLEFIETTSQFIDEDEKKEIENTFGTKLVNQFGCREVWNIAYECPCGNMHINSKYLLLDIVDENGKIIREENKVGNVIFTSLIHKSFPFIKYYLGDRARIEYKKCGCGSKHTVIHFEEGRRKDQLINTTYYGTTIFRKIMRYIYFKCENIGVKNVSIIQDGDFHITVYVNLKNTEKLNDFIKEFLKTTYFLANELRSFGFEFVLSPELKENDKVLKHEIFTNIL